MNEPSSDEELRALFLRQRSAENEGAPDFQTVCSRIREAAPTPRWRLPEWRWAMRGAAALGLAMSGAVWFHHVTKAPLRSRDNLALNLDQLDADLQKGVTAQTALTAWQSPTDFLLNPTYHHENTP